MISRSHLRVNGVAVLVYQTMIPRQSEKPAMRQTEREEFAISGPDDKFMNLVEESTLSLVWLPKRIKSKEQNGGTAQ